MIEERKTKIIATIGPALLQANVLRQVLPYIGAFRFNFSHLNESKVEQIFSQLREILGMQLEDIPVAFIADLRGREIRSEAVTFTLQQGEEVLFKKKTKEELELLEPSPMRKAGSLLIKKPQIIGIDHGFLYNLVEPGQRITADDGELIFSVKAIEQKAVRVVVEKGGVLKSHKAINVPGHDLKLPMHSKEDKRSLRYIAKQRFNWVAASFVNDADDIAEVRSFLKKQGSSLPIIAKIESNLAVKNIDEIIDAAEGVMVARGDLGENFADEDVPVIQELVLKKAREKGRVNIIATQMLDSMIENPRPKRAEATDVAQSSRLRADAVMLSGETAIGKHPGAAIKVMHRILCASEKYWTSNILQEYKSKTDIMPICRAALQLASASAVRHVITVTKRGKSAVLLSSFRPDITCIVAGMNKELVQRSYLYYAISPISIKETTEKDKRFDEILQNLRKVRRLKKGETVIFLYAYPFFMKKSTNTIRLLEV